MQLTPFVPLWLSRYPLAGSNKYVVAFARRCGGAALSAKRVSKNSGIRSSFGIDMGTLSSVFFDCARQAIHASRFKMTSDHESLMIFPPSFHNFISCCRG